MALFPQASFYLLGTLDNSAGAPITPHKLIRVGKKLQGHSELLRHWLTRAPATCASPPNNPDRNCTLSTLSSRYWCCNGMPFSLPPCCRHT